MNGLDQAFIDAYRTSEVPAGDAGKRQASPQTDRGQAGATRRRVDAPVGRVVPRPHMPIKPPAEVVTQQYCVEISTWDAGISSAATFVTADVLNWVPDGSNVQQEQLVIPGSPVPTAKPDQPAPAAKAEPAAKPSKPAPATAAGKPGPAVRPGPAVQPGPATKPVPVAKTERPATAAAAQIQSLKPVQPKVEDPVAEPLHEEQAEAAANPMSEPFRPVWEVDRFMWPSDAEAIYSAEDAYFAHAGQKLREAAREGLRALAISSARSGEGCTTLAICLARAASEAGMRVALMDANLRAPKLGQRMGVKFPHSWQDALRGDAPLGETAISSVERPVTLLPLATESRVDDWSSEQQFASLVRTVSEAVDLLIVDLGTSFQSVGRCLDSAERCPFDAAIVVRDVRRTSEHETLIAAQQLKGLGVNAVGIAENYSPRSAAEPAAA
jgi:Mrp family chromosome partitioning ATPase